MMMSRTSAALLLAEFEYSPVALLAESRAPGPATWLPKDGQTPSLHHVT